MGYVAHAGRAAEAPTRRRLRSHDHRDLRVPRGQFGCRWIARERRLSSGKLPPHKLGVPAGSTAIVVSAVADPRRTPDWRDDMESADATGDAADASAFMRTSESASNWRMCSDSRLKRSAASRFALWLLPRSFQPQRVEQRLERAGIVASSRMLVAARTGNRGFGDSAEQVPRQRFDRLPRNQAVVHRVLERKYEAAAEITVVDLAPALPTKHGRASWSTIWRVVSLYTGPEISLRALRHRRNCVLLQPCDAVDFGE
jgi:hypothetical protein